MEEAPAIVRKNLAGEVHRLKEENQKSDIPLSISCGITTTLLSGRDYERLYQDADRALYEAKEAGRGCYKIYTEEMK